MDEATTQYKEALEGSQSVGDRARIIFGLAGLGGVLATQGQYETAARLLGAADGLSDGGIGSTNSSDAVMFNADVSTLRSAMSEEAFAAAWETGRAFSIAEALAAATSSAAI